MHPELLKEIVSLCKRRQAQGDHPTEPITDAEVLENAIVQLSAIESAATEPLLQRIAELEKALKLVQQHHATAWNRGHIAGMAANRMVAQDALNAVKKDAWNNTQLTEALMAAEGRCEELERQLEEARNQVLEEAAVECDKRAHAGDAGALMAARAIRALKGAKE